jgi:hypothetical protein
MRLKEDAVPTAFVFSSEKKKRNFSQSYKFSLYQKKKER